MTTRPENASPQTKAQKAWGMEMMLSAEFPDKRLVARAGQILATLAAKPADSIPQACAKWPDTKAAYRFIENERVKSADIVKPLADAGARACEPHDTVLSVQDTTGITFPKATRMSGLGPVNATDVRGLCLHTTLAVSLEGLPLGALDLQCWAHAEKGLTAPSTKKSRPIEEKESAKWLRGIDAVRGAFERNRAANKPCRLVHVFDREGDIHDIFQHIVDGGDGAVIRSMQNRNVRGGKAYEEVRATVPLARYEIQVPRSQGQAARPPAHVELRACRMTLAPNAHSQPARRSLELTLVEVWEATPPDGVKEPLHWLLWTTEDVESPAQARVIVDIYKLRWRIEDYHTVLKCGCGIEELRLETAERAAKVIFLYAAVAVRVLQLRDLSRTQPDIPCTVILSECEWRALYTYIQERPPAPNESPPSIAQATLWIGRLGGHLGRKGDGMPGMRSLWRGWRDLSIMAELFQAAMRQF